MDILYKDICDIKNGIIVHQVNCRHVMGAGVALAIRRKYPKHYSDFMSKSATLGDIVVTKINNSLYIVGMYSQLNYGSKVRQTDYEAMKICLDKIIDFRKAHKLVVYMPYGIGCGLAGGDWNIVSEIILDRLPMTKFCSIE